MTDRNEARQNVWKLLHQVAKPDSRFHLNFAEFIPDFQGSDQATERLVRMDVYKQAKVVFITPDNCLEQLRAQAIRDGKVLIISTYGIRRGLVELLPAGCPHWPDRLCHLAGCHPESRALYLLERIERTLR